ncbi:MAG TPA: glycosyltransferase [Saprospiraceae bacterium]|nr:glycosyltransferase [Saprospiraceae bacterium]
MIAVMEWLWFFSLLLLTGYHMVIFRRRPSPRSLSIIEWPGVSIVIAHKNDSTALRENLESLLSQDYPLFEIIIIDDHSNPFEKSNLEYFISGHSGVKLLSSDTSGKKHAITKGINSATHDLILCTDADCKPSSNKWIKKMIESGRGLAAVLGYSPYEKKSGWLNLLIRFETIMTAMQYISWTLAGKPYMGVGRNMLYPRSLFLQLDPYKEIAAPYGDDDLWVQQLSDHIRIKVCDDPLAHVMTQAPATWKEWINQKHRHMSAGHYYKNKLLWQPGIYGMMLFLHWAILPLLIAASFWWKWCPVLLIGLLIRWFVYNSWTRKLGDKDTVKWYPVLELNYAIYLGMMGIYTWMNKRKKWN